MSDVQKPKGNNFLPPMHLMNQLKAHPNYPIDSIYELSDFGVVDEDEYPIDSIYEDEDGEDTID